MRYIDECANQRLTHDHNARSVTGIRRRCGTYAYLIGSVVQGAITVGDFVLYFGAVTGFSDFVGKIIKSVNDLHEANLHMNDIPVYQYPPLIRSVKSTEQFHDRRLPGAIDAHKRDLLLSANMH